MISVSRGLWAAPAVEGGVFDLSDGLPVPRPCIDTRALPELQDSEPLRRLAKSRPLRKKTLKRAHYFYHQQIGIAPSAF